MKKILALVFLCLSLGMSNTYAQTDTKKALVKELMQSMNSASLADQILGSMIDYYKKQGSSIPDTFWEEMAKEINGTELTNLIIPVYEKYYTEEDLKKLILFYNSEVGKKTIQLMPLIMQESMIIGRDWGLKLSEKVQAKLKEKGY
jgi:uncharacterized protein